MGIDSWGTGRATTASGLAKTPNLDKNSTKFHLTSDLGCFNITLGYYNNPKQIAQIDELHFFPLKSHFFSNEHCVSSTAFSMTKFKKLNIWDAVKVNALFGWHYNYQVIKMWAGDLQKYEMHMHTCKSLLWYFELLELNKNTKQRN